MIQNIKYLKTEVEKLNLSISKAQLDKLSGYFDEVIENNKLFNLTAITEENDFIDKHYIDSMIGISEIPSGASILDIGAGGGFPSVPIAIMRTDVKVTSIDSTAKKMVFVKNASEKLGINNIDTISGRAEEMPLLKNKFDVVTARAVASLPILLELSVPLLKVGGLFIAYKTDISELDSSLNAIKVLNVEYVKSKEASLPNGDKRTILVFRKKGPTDNKYPRQYGTIKKKPL